MLLAGADPTVISTVNNPAKYSDNAFIRDKSGAGMVNAVNAINIAKNSQHANKIIYVDMTSTLGEQDMSNVTLLAGQKIRIVMTYIKTSSVDINYDGYLSYDAGLELYSGSTLCASSCHDYCNVEVIEFTATTAGIYTIRVNTEYMYDTHSDDSWSVAVAWNIN